MHFYFGHNLHGFQDINLVNPENTAILSNFTDVAQKSKHCTKQGLYKQN